MITLTGDPRRARGRSEPSRAPNSEPRASTLPPLPGLPGSWRRDVALVAMVFLASRAFVLLAFWLRGRAFPFMDATGYVNQASWLATHASLNIPDEAGGRFFHGVPLVVSLLGRLTGEFSWTGLFVSHLAGLGACLLFYRNFTRLSWTLWFACLLPAWVANSATYNSEASQWLLCLAGLTALRLPPATALRHLLFVLAGYAFVCRATAALIVMPFLVLALAARPRDWRSLAIDSAALAFFPALILGWSLLETGHLFVQQGWQAREFAQWTHRYGDAFPPSVFAWPGQSFLAGLGSGAVPLLVKVFNLAHFLVWIVALGLAARAWLRNRTDSLSALIAVELVVNGLFILTIGGPFGHTLFYRFLATQANVFVLLALFRELPLPRLVWWLGSAASIVLACLASSGA